MLMTETVSVKLDRSTLNIQEKQYVEYKNEIFQISTIIDLKEVVAINLETKKHHKLYIKDLKPASLDHDNPSKSRDISLYSDEEFQEVQKKYQAISPMLKNDMTRKEIEEHANALGVHFTTLYRWLEKYRSTGTLMGLVPKPAGRVKGSTRLSPSVEKIIRDTIENHYLTSQKLPAQEIIRIVHHECKVKELEIPGKNTIRNRINQLSAYEVLKKRGERSKAKTIYEPVPGKFERDYPLQVIQIDHTNVDLIIVDDENRQPIGRPYLTLAVDIYSRMITGYYLSLDPPSSASVAMCITNAVLQKDQLLLDMGLNSNWDVWGFPEEIYVDNGADFRADALRNAGLIYGINIEFRPVKSTHYGGHIERLIGTVMRQAHIIPGTTKENIFKKGEYDAEKHASMTFKEFEQYLVKFITKIYHKSIHGGIGMTPERRWNEGLHDDENPRGLPPKPTDPLTITLDFMPAFERTIQKNGVNIDGLNYYAHLLRTKINSIDPETNKKKKFIFKRDPRNIKYVWFYNEEMSEYFKIPVADQSMPDMALWEYNMIRKRLKEKGNKDYNYFQILEGYAELHEDIRESSKKTKKAKRMNQRIKNNALNIEDHKPVNVPKDTPRSTDASNGLWDEEVTDFDGEW